VTQVAEVIGSHRRKRIKPGGSMTGCANYAHPEVPNRLESVSHWSLPQVAVTGR